MAAKRIFRNDVRERKEVVCGVVDAKRTTDVCDVRLIV